MDRSLFNGVVYSIKCVSGLQSVNGGFSMYSTKKTEHQDISVYC